MQQHKTLTFELKSLDESGVFAGYASVFGVLDSQADIIERGAFKASIAGLDGKGRIHEIKLLWQHDLKQPIGVIEVLREDAMGLYIQARLLVNQVAKAGEAYALIKSGVVGGLSIGYSVVRQRYDEKRKIRHITQVDLWEVSLVTFPANSAAKITVIKGAKYPECELQHLDFALNKALAALQLK